MGEHPHASLVRDAITAMNRGEAHFLDDLVADDVVWHEIGLARPILGKPALRRHFAAARPDIRISGTIHDVVANDDHVLALVLATATHHDRTFSYRTSEIFHVRDGQITERWVFSDDTAAIESFFHGA